MSFLKRIFNKTAKVEPNTLSEDSLFTLNKGKIYPWVKVIISDDDQNPDEKVFEFKGADNPIVRPWLGDLIILYVIDTGDNFQVILKRDLPESVSEEELHNIAVENLNRDIEYKLMDTNFGGNMLTAGGDHEAGAICLPGIWKWLADHLNSSLIVAIPSKDLVLMVPKGEDDKISNLKIFVHEIFKDCERLLTRNIFEYNKDTADWSIIDLVKDNSNM